MNIKDVKETQINIKDFKEKLIKKGASEEEVNLFNGIYSIYFEDTKELIVFTKVIETELTGKVLA